MFCVFCKFIPVRLFVVSKGFALCFEFVGDQRGYDNWKVIGRELLFSGPEGIYGERWRAEGDVWGCSGVHAVCLMRDVSVFCGVI